METTLESFLDAGETTLGHRPDLVVGETYEAMGSDDPRMPSSPGCRLVRIMHCNFYSGCILVVIVILQYSNHSRFPINSTSV
jgi:hypothetical protein